MGKKIKLREAQRRAAEHAMAARLRAHSGPKRRRGFIQSYSDFSADYRARLDGYRGFALRAPDDWQCSTRVRAPEQRFLDLVRFTFAAYPVARHLEEAWLVGNVVPVDPLVAAPGHDGRDTADFRQWYITVAQGGSLYRTATSGFMSRIETHHFVNTPRDLSVTQRAFWYAYARAQTSDAGVAVRVARTKLAGFPVTMGFWQDVARFFARSPTNVAEMNDLIDFIGAARDNNEDFSLVGRTLPALRQRMEEWHRAQSGVADGLRWSGSAMPDVFYITGDETPSYAIWRFRQLKTDHELVGEGLRMAHCVASYRYNCAMDRASIWSLTCEIDDEVFACLTIELRRHEIVQCRGRFNRLPTPEAAAVVKRWAQEFGLICGAYELREAA